ncbi:hypothetical protein WJX72_006473 [[Myrmecia] bisecta]|uniref:Uncharacterized protein n=1 Tax=[Myrmecia] bisecta TaxID=41462 RepID=A0AAW1PLH8_9CHLO
MAAEPPAARVPDLTTLGKARVVLDGVPSPASLQSVRVAVQDDQATGACRVFAASGPDVYSMRVPRHASCAGERGKEGVFIPAIIQAVMPDRLPNDHQAEVQSMAYVDCTGDEDGAAVLGSVDAFGRVVVARFDGQPHQPVQPIQTYDLRPADATREGGASSSSLLAVTEGCEISLWDARAAEKGGCMQRVRPGTGGGLLYALAAAHTAEGAAYLGAAGADRSVFVLDPRTWKMLDIWANCLKYEILSLSFSVTDPHYAFVAGLDSEVLCGRWDSVPRQGGGMRTGEGLPHLPVPSTDIKGQSFRGDSRWLGIARAASSDLLAGFSASAHMYLASFTPSSTESSLNAADWHQMTPHLLRHKQAAITAAEKLGHLEVAA